MLVHACMCGQMRTWNAQFYHSLPYSLETGSISELGIWAWGLHWWPACPGDPAVSGSLLVASPWSSPRMAFRSSCLRYQTLTHWTIVPALSMDDFWGRFNTISGRIWLSENGRCNCHNYTLKRKGSDQQRGHLISEVWETMCDTQIVSSAVVKKYWPFRGEHTMLLLVLTVKSNHNIKKSKQNAG